MSTRPTARNLFSSLDNPELTIRRRSRTDPTLLNDSEMAAEGNGDLPIPDLRTMEELCQPSLNVQNSCLFHGLPVDDANKHLDKFLHVTQSIKVNGVTDDALRLYLFPHSMTHHATAWFDRLPRNSINTFEQMAKMFLGKYFPPSMVTKLRNEITISRQCPDESLFEAWERYKLSIDQCPNHNMLPVTQVDTFYNGLTLRHRDTINAAARGTLMKRLTPNCETCGGPHSFNDCLATVGNTQNVYAAGAYQGNHNPQGNNQGRNQFFQGASHGQNQPPAYRALVYQASVHQPQIPQPQVVTTNFMKANDVILKNMQTNMTSLTNSNLELKNMFGQFMKMNTALSSGSETLLVNTITNPKEDLKGITTRSGTVYQGPMVPTTSSSLIVERETEATKDMVHPTNNESTEDVQPLVVLTESPILNSKPVIAPIIEPVASPVSSLKPNQRPSIPYPSRLHDQKLSLADLGANINLMPLSVWNKLSLLELTPTLMTLELADRSISRPIGVAEDVYAKVRKFHFPAEFVFVDFNADPRVPLILGRSFLKIERALIYVFEGELTLRVGKEALTFNLDQTSRYSANYNDMTANQIDVFDMDCEEYSGIQHWGATSKHKLTSH
nr:reverse transcriptase domain-containing protein [Tanacetum cinerariifolium]